MALRETSDDGVILPGSTVIEKKPSRRKGDLGPAKQLELLNAGELIRADRAGPHNDSLSYMANILVRLTMPHRSFKDANGKPSTTFMREYNGLSITIQAHPKIGLPYGSVPRLLMSFITTEAVRTRQPVIELGRSLRAFLLKLGYATNSGGPRGTATLVKDQLKRLFSSNVSILDSRDDGFAIQNVNVAKRAVMWWDQKNLDQLSFFNSTVELSTDFFREIIEHPVPVDMRALQALSHSPMCLDIYCYLTWRYSHLRKREGIEWRDLQVQFGANYPMNSSGLRDFRNAFRQHMKAVHAVFPEAKVDLADSRYAILMPSPTHVPMRSAVQALDRLAVERKSER
jgi:hypothetical protein